MPELPEVETIVNDLLKVNIVGCTIQKVEIFWHKTVSQTDLDSFCKKLIHQKIIGLERRGKYLVFSLSSGEFLCVHLRMTGRLLLEKGAIFDNPHIRLRLLLDHQKRLDYYDTRKFGRWTLIKDLSTIFEKIGPEPLLPEFTPHLFMDNAAKALKGIKTLASRSKFSRWSWKYLCR